ncbi:uncharacterized protein RHIMIDRAFT_82151 [Rhizopus microsporus ATCC 52813]|uniref:Uncharacterized protein n=1 Tax=Rhizopus microsporus ATCC 52813 TaxID=1340429 RepID=A0A2G4SHX2_RHIZD|nr:uncharacterized protein RHIMIDRAFT_82151 [Rhizopus microsporus ATCC 52813]PHZ07986.1 hypothetical protein RHIMIDRAFT_82151 [Rhizopus microsporus ATCC 52813]
MIPFSLDMHVDRPWIFSKQFIEIYSEADYQYKFWSYIFELFLGRRQDVLLRWGDTISGSCKKVGKKFKLDLRLVMIQDDENIVDGCTGEMAKKATELPYIRAQDVPLIKMPIIQIAGFNGKLSVISLPKKKEYKLEDIFSFCFPKSLKQIETGSLENLINFLSTVDDMLDNLRKIYHDNSSSVANDIENILTEVNQKKKLNYNAWITKATFEKEDDDEDDEDDEDDDEEDDEEDDDEEGDKKEDDREEDDKEEDDEEEDDDDG